MERYTYKIFEQQELESNNRTRFIRFYRPNGTYFDQVFVNTTGSYQEYTIPSGLDTPHIVLMEYAPSLGVKQVGLALLSEDGAGRRDPKYALLGGTASSLTWLNAVNLEYIDLDADQISPEYGVDVIECILEGLHIAFSQGEDRYFVHYQDTVTDPTAIYDLSLLIYSTSATQQDVLPFDLRAVLDSEAAQSDITDLDSRVTAIEELIGTSGFQSLFVAR